MPKLQQNRQALKEETRRTKFERLGTARMNKALNSIRLLGNLAAPTYEWTHKDIDRIHDSLIECLTDTLHRFEKKGKTEKKKFNFPRQKEHRESNDNRKSV